MEGPESGCRSPRVNIFVSRTTEVAARSLASGPRTGRCSPLTRGVLRELEYIELAELYQWCSLKAL
jgi:hypothetical protein